MIKKVLLPLLIVALAAGAFVGYRQIRNRTIQFSETNVYTLLPSQTVAFFESKNVLELQKTMPDSVAYNFADIKSLTEDVQFFSEITSLVVERKNKTENNDYQFVYAFVADSAEVFPLVATKMTKNEMETFVQETTKGAKKESEKFHSVEIVNFPDKGFSATYCAGVFVASPKKQVLQMAVTGAQNRKSVADADSIFSKLSKTAGKNSVASLFLNMSKIQLLTKNTFADNSLTNKVLQNFASWVVFDVSFDKNQISLNGYADAAENYTTASLADQQPVSMSLVGEMPQNTAACVALGVSDFNSYLRKIKKDKALASAFTKNAENFLTTYFTGELVAGVAPVAGEWQGNEFVLLSLSDSTFVTEELDKIATKTSRISEYTAKSITVYRLPEDMNLSLVAGDFSVAKKMFASVVGGSLLLAETESSAHDLAGQITAGYVFDKSPKYAFVSENFSESSTAGFFVDFQSVVNAESSAFSDAFEQKIKDGESFFGNLKALCGQVESEHGMFYCSTFALFGGKSENVAVSETPKKKSSSIIWETEFSGEPLFGPVIVQNPSKKESEILVQDDSKKLHCYSNDGKLLWSSVVDDEIFENSLSQVDFLKNGKYQFVFNTKKSIYIIDRKGNSVGKYPIALPQEASAPMSVFDYDGNKDYRFFVPCTDRQILLYNKDGKRIPDWNLKKTDNVVSLPVQYLRLLGKDYILVTDGAMPYILDRRGNVRVQLKSKVAMSENNPFFLLYNKSSKPCLITTDNSGYLKQIDFSGNVTSQKLIENLSAKHYFLRIGTPQKPVYVFVDNGKLYAYDKDLKNTFSAEFGISDCLPRVNGDYVMIYSPSQEKMEIFSAQKSEMVGQSFSSVVSPYIGSLLPMQGTYILVVNENKLICIYLNN